MVKLEEVIEFEGDYEYLNPEEYTLLDEDSYTRSPRAALCSAAIATKESGKQASAPALSTFPVATDSLTGFIPSQEHTPQSLHRKQADAFSYTVLMSIKFANSPSPNAIKSWDSPTILSVTPI